MITGRGRLRTLAVACLMVLGAGGVPVAAEPEPACAETGRVFAVEAGTGHLDQIRTCSDGTATLGRPTVVEDAADWRAYPAVFAMSDGDAVVVYAVSPAGELWWRRQDAPDAALRPPVRLAGDIDWRHDVVFAARPGYLALGDFDAPLRLFRHDGWAVGGPDLVEQAPLFTMFHGPAITALAPGSGYAIGVWQGMNYRVWREPDRPGHDDLWYPSGDLPTGVSGVTGAGTSLYGVSSDGGVVRLWQRTPPILCAGVHNSWQVGARVPGRFSRVVVPAGGDPAGPPALRSAPVGRLAACGVPHELPWEWQP